MIRRNANSKSPNTIYLQVSPRSLVEVVQPFIENLK